MPPSACIDLSTQQQTLLLSLARQAIETTVESGHGAPLELGSLPPPLRQPRGVFVTLSKAGALRGCIGSLQASEALALAVVDAARGAACRDPRFAPLHQRELAATHIEVSVLSPMQEITATDRKDLLQALRPNIDGLLVEDGNQQATFLPKVWQQLPQAEDFLDHLLVKAGLAPGHWSAKLRLFRYQALCISEPGNGGSTS